MKNFNGEYIVCSAIWYDDGCFYRHQPKNIKSGFVVLGMRHCNCLITTQILKGKELNITKVVDGFLTSHNLFVDRIDAVEIAHRSGQIKEIKNMLFSEDIY